MFRTEMQRFAQGVAFDERAMPELDSEAIDFRVASELFAPVRRLRRRDLETLPLMTAHQGRKVPTVCGIILFGTDRLRHFPDAWIQAGRFRGTDRATIANHAEFKLPLLQGIDSTIAFVEKHSTRSVLIGRVHGRLLRKHNEPESICFTATSTGPSTILSGIGIRLHHGRKRSGGRS